MLARRAAGRDADDLAGTALQDQKITNAHMVARDRNGVRHASHPVAASGSTVERTRLVGLCLVTGRLDFAVTDFNSLLTLLYAVVLVGVVRVVVVTAAVDGVQDAVRGTRDTVAEGVIVAVFVVISHITLVLVLGGCVDRGTIGNLDVLVVLCGVSLGVGSGWVVAGMGALVLPVTGGTVLLSEGYGAVSVVPLGDVDAGVDVDLGCWGVTRVAVLAVFDVELSVGVAVVRLVVAMDKPSCQSLMDTIEGEGCRG